MNKTQTRYKVQIPFENEIADLLMWAIFASITCMPDNDDDSIWLIDWLVFNGTSTQKGQFVPTACMGGKPAQSAKDGLRDTMHITLRYAIAM